MAFSDLLSRVASGETLSAMDAEAAMALILEGAASTAQMAAFLVALRLRGETGDELYGFARAMRAKSERVDAGAGPVLDTCGTGGDGLGTFNISTVAALVVAGAGVKVAKHGNRSVTSPAGSADVLEALGVKIDLTPERMGRSIREVGIGFLFAPALHPAMKNAMPARRELKMRTVFNLLGPLTNPAGASRQLLGAPSERSAELMAGALARLGTEHAFVVHGSDGLDEVTTTGETLAFEIRGSEVRRLALTPEQFGVARAKIENLRAGDRAEVLRIARAVLAGEKGAARDIVLVNASVALMAAGRAGDFREGVAVAAESIDGGKAVAKLDALAHFSQGV